SLLAAAVAFQTAVAHSIVLPAHGVECFYEQLHKDDTMTVTFQVGDREFGSAGNLEIDFWVRQWLHVDPSSMDSGTRQKGGGWRLANMTILTDHQPVKPIRVQREVCDVG